MAITKINTPELFDLGTTNSSLRLPSGNTASRPTNPNTGEWRYNTDDNYVEYWDGSDWFQIDYESTVVPCTTNTINYPTAVTAYYKMEDATDQTGNYNGTATNVNFNVAGKFGNAGEFNGSSSQITYSQQVVPSTATSISFWYNPSGTTQVNYLMGGGVNTADKGVTVGYNGSTNQFFGLVAKGVSSLAGVVVSNTTYSNTGWYNIVFVWDGTTSTNAMKLYINGVLDGENTSDASAASIGSYSFFNIGGVSGSSSQGSIDQLRIFPSALTAAQATQLYNEVQCAPTIVPSEHFNVNTYVGNGSTQTIDAKFNEAAVFNGSSSYISASIPFLNARVTSAVSLWIKYTDTGAYRSVFNDYSNTANFNHNIIVNQPSTGNLRFFSAYGGNTGYKIIESSGLTLNDGNWHHIVSTVDLTTNTLTGYVDGVSVGNVTVSTNAWTGTTQNLQIGRQETGAYFNGSIDQVRIFNTALTLSQVTDLYNNETDATAQLLDFPVGAGCIAAYELDGDASDVGKTYGGIPTNIGYTGLQFAPDLVWIKSRNEVNKHVLTDVVRGTDKQLFTDSQDVESGNTNRVTSFLSNGFTLGTQATFNRVNLNGINYVAWNWKSGGAAVSNTDGDNNSAMVSANPDAGFSIITYTGTGTNNSSVGHGLDSRPEMFIYKRRSSPGSWGIVHKDVNNYKAYLAFTSAGATNDTNMNAPTDEVIRFNTTSPTYNGINQNWLIYAFHSVEGFSKIGSYIGTNAPNNYIVTGFEPAFVMIKSTGATNGDWNIFDNKRNTPNPLTDVLKANTDGTETTEAALNINFNSNGFTLNGATNAGGRGQINSSGITYIFMAIAADPAPEPVLANSFDTVIWSADGTSGDIDINSVGFQPDFVWAKIRTQPYSHTLFDSVRGVGSTHMLWSDGNHSESQITTNASGNGFVSSFNINGFTGATGTSANSYFNLTGNDYVAWCWKAAGIPAINQNGTIDSIVSANPAAGFSIVKYITPSGGAGTLGHGLSSAPEVYITKRLDSASDWYFNTTAIDGSLDYLILNSTATKTDSSGISLPTSTVFNAANFGSQNEQWITYCFHSVAGHSKIGSYPGTGLAGNFVSTSVGGDAGFEPAFVMWKAAIRPSGGGSWYIYDNKRTTSNPQGQYLQANEPAQEFDGTSVFNIDFNSNGFTVNGTNNEVNQGGSTYIYMAFA